MLGNQSPRAAREGKYPEMEFRLVALICETREAGIKYPL
jgi:hypothetical protein